MRKGSFAGHNMLQRVRWKLRDFLTQLFIVDEESEAGEGRFPRLPTLGSGGRAQARTVVSPPSLVLFPSTSWPHASQPLSLRPLTRCGLKVATP